MSKIIQKIRLNYKIQVALHLFYKTIDNKTFYSLLILNPYK